MADFLGDKETLKGITQTLMEAKTGINRAAIALENLRPLVKPESKDLKLTIDVLISNAFNNAQGISEIYEALAPEAFK